MDSLGLTDSHGLRIISTYFYCFALGLLGLLVFSGSFSVIQKPVGPVCILTALIVAFYVSRELAV